MSKRWRFHVIAISVIAFFSILPVLNMLIAIGLAELNKCTFQDGNIDSCKVLGIEAGELLGVMFSNAWLALFTVPVGLVFILLYILIIGFLLWRRRRRELF